MVKRVNCFLTFDYDSDSDSVSNVKIEVEGSTEKVTKTKTVKAATNSAMTSMVFRDKNKLILSPKLIEMLELEADDRVSIVYEVKDGFSTPLIGKGELFGGKESGNKLTKSNTIAYRGANNTVLEEYGTNFDAEMYKDGIAKLISLDKPLKEVETVKEAFKEVKAEIITKEDKEYELKDTLFSFDNL